MLERFSMGELNMTEKVQAYTDDSRIVKAGDTKHAKNAFSIFDRMSRQELEQIDRRVKSLNVKSDM